MVLNLVPGYHGTVVCTHRIAVRVCTHYSCISVSYESAQGSPGYGTLVRPVPYPGTMPGTTAVNSTRILNLVPVGIHTEGFC